MWQAYNVAVHVPDPNAPGLALYATGEALRTLKEGLESLKKQALKGTGEVAVRPKVTEIAPAMAPTRIAVKDCLDDSKSKIVRAGPGAPYHDTPGGRRLTTAQVERQADGSWKVMTFGAQKVGTC
jgi:hypothetical protein